MRSARIREPESEAQRSGGTRRQLESKELLLADPRGVWFTTPHWNGYPGILLHIPDLKQLSKTELREAVVEAWLMRAPKKVAKAWLEATS